MTMGVAEACLEYGVTANAIMRGRAPACPPLGLICCLTEWRSSDIAEHPASIAYPLSSKPSGEYRKPCESIKAKIKDLGIPLEWCLDEEWTSQHFRG